MLDFRDYDTRLAAYAVVVDERQRILLASWNEVHPAQWTMPGGGVEYEESPAEAAVREVHEETGYDVELVGLLGLDIHRQDAVDRLSRTDRPLRSVRVVYEARVVGGALCHEVDGTTDEARWFPLADVSTLPRVSLVDASLRLWTAMRQADGAV